jgi:hypothetical protein
MDEGKHKVLLILIAMTFIGELISIILWTVNPTLPSGLHVRFTLAVDYTIAVANATVFFVLNLFAFMLVLRRNKFGPVFLIIISIVNRIISHPIFIGGVHLIFLTWTVLLVIFAYLDYRKISKQQKTNPTEPNN